MDFDFISDTKFRTLLRRDFIELEACYKAKATKSVLILTGSIIEAILVEYFLNNLPNGKTKEQVLRDELHSLIDLAHKDKLISTRTKDLSTVIRNYRNLIHPGREVRENEQFDEDTATVSFSLLKIITSEIKENYLKKYGYTATDIISKLETDALSYSIFEQLIERLNTSERNKLLNELTEYNLREFQHGDKEIEDIKSLIQTLKPFLSKEIILEQLDKLFKKVQTSDQWQIIKLYNLYHEDLSLLPQSDREIIITYILTYLEHHLEDGEIRNFYFEKNFQTIGNYIDSPRLKEAIKKSIISYIVNYQSETDWLGIGFFNQIMNSLEPKLKKEIEDYIENEMPEFSKKEFKKHFDSIDSLPF